MGGRGGAAGCLLGARVMFWRGSMVLMAVLSGGGGGLGWGCWIGGRE